MHSTINTKFSSSTAKYAVAPAADRARRARCTWDAAAGRTRQLNLASGLLLAPSRDD
eukprot:SAG11_NODE_23417_length_389_cov_0.424138_1_plen_56_part_10